MEECDRTVIEEGMVLTIMIENLVHVLPSGIEQHAQAAARDRGRLLSARRAPYWWEEGQDLLSDRQHRVGIDIGGRFTDLVLIEDATGERAAGEVLTTPRDRSEAVEKGLMELLEREDLPPLGQTLHRSSPL